MDGLVQKRNVVSCPVSVVIQQATKIEEGAGRLEMGARRS